MNKKHDLKEFNDLADLLTNVEIHDSAKKEQIFNRLKYKMDTGTIQPNYTTKDGINMKNKKWKSIAAGAFALVCVTGAFSSTSYAQDMIQTILAKFQVGNLEITQYDKEKPASELNSTKGKEEQANEPVQIQMETPPVMTLKQARLAMGSDFAVSTWLSDHYKLTNYVIQGDQMVEVQYQKDEEMISLLISKGGTNGIGTTDEVQTEIIDGKTVYFANGIVIWEHEGFTYEMYQMAEKNFDADTIGQIIGTLSTENE